MKTAKEIANKYFSQARTENSDLERDILLYLEYHLKDKEIRSAAPAAPEVVVTAFMWCKEICKLINGKYVGEKNQLTYSFESMMHTGHCVDNGQITIHSIRVGDIEYSVGEEAMCRAVLPIFEPHKITIKSFSYLKNDNEYHYRVQYDDGDGEGDADVPVTSLSGKPAKRTPLFATEDSVEVHVGDHFWGTVSLGQPVLHKANKDKTKSFVSSECIKTFSTREAAEAFIDLNKKQYSKADLIAAKSETQTFADLVLVDFKKLGI